MMSITLGPYSTADPEAGPLEFKGTAEEPPILTPWKRGIASPRDLAELVYAASLCASQPKQVPVN